MSHKETARDAAKTIAVLSVRTEDGTPETRSAPVMLSVYHSGQPIENSATMRAEGHYYTQHGRLQWRPRRWQAAHVVTDTSLPPSDTDRREVTESTWHETMREAEAWLEARGLLIGGTYWHAARAE